MHNEFVCQSCGSLLEDKGGCHDCHGAAAVVPIWPIVRARAMAQFTEKLAAWTAAQAQGVPTFGGGWLHGGLCGA